MEYAEARHTILLHGPGTSDPEGRPLVLEDGFLGCLRPYQGLHERNFHIVMEALLSVGEQLHSAQELDRELVYSIWSICHTARGYGLTPYGMLQRNRLITPTDTARLERWVDMLEVVGLRLLRGWPPHHAVSYYADYVTEFGWWENAAYFVELMARSLSDTAVDDSIESITLALIMLGSRASAAIPALRDAELREYSYYTPIERCTQEVREYIRRAIQALEGCESPQVWRARG